MMSIYEMWRKIRGHEDDNEVITQPMPVTQEALERAEFATSELTEAIQRTMDAIRERHNG